MFLQTNWLIVIERSALNNNITSVHNEIAVI
jgi:hypothetical protein